jgi:YidC/Oxa1 family membrane protein insertase
MDKKNTVIGVLLLIAAMAAFWVSNRYAPQQAPIRPGTTPSTANSPLATNQAPAPGPASSPSDAVITASPAAALAPAEYVTLANEFISVKFTNHGGAIDSIALLKKAAHLDAKGNPTPERYTLNAPQAAPALSLADFPGADAKVAYTLVSQTATEVVYRATSNNLEVTRRYSLQKTAALDDYQLRHETTFRNVSAGPLALPRAVFNLGTASPLSDTDTSGIYLNVGYYDGEDAEFVQRDELASSGMFSSAPPPTHLDKPAAIRWASVKNQFFAMILTPDQPGAGVRVERVKVNPLLMADNRAAYGVTAYAQFDLKPLPAGASTTFGANYYAGPKEYKRFANTDIFKHNERDVMQFNSGIGKVFFSGFFAPLLLTIMNWVQSIVPNWGWAIVITTLILKIVFLPLTLAASRSAKRMAKLQPHMQAMREKYKDNPQKMQTETLRLFKENKVNPVGGCIPILITIPFFIGFFTMLQSASELRFASFLWVNDLAAQDTIYSFGTVTLPLLGLTHLNINIMPILMGATMIIQMRLTPTPTTDPAQQMMFKIMPWIFTLFCYTFASGLALYSTINGLFTIGQQMVINRMPEPELPINTGPAKSGPGGMKNVTPKSVPPSKKKK